MGGKTRFQFKSTKTGNEQILHGIALHRYQKLEKIVQRLVVHRVNTDCVGLRVALFHEQGKAN